MNNKQISTLLASMSLKEKVYQLVQIPGSYYQDSSAETGTNITDRLSKEDLSLVGSVLSVSDISTIETIQRESMKNHPHHIPMLFMMDVIHGYRTIFPMPLAQGATFDPDLLFQCAEAAAREASADGIHVTFAPMLDLVRDARWGRIMESTGEDPYLNSIYGEALVSGFDGNSSDRIDTEHVACCIKHFAAYGAAEAGRDYTNTELSEHTLREYYLKSYKAAIEHGADMVMTSFNSLNGIPATGNSALVNGILRREWNFDGVVISDWNGIGELVSHGICRDIREAAKLAILNGIDVDMCSLAFAKNLESLVLSHEVSESVVDRACMRVLRLKNKLGLFEDPLRAASADRVLRNTLTKENRALACRAVEESLVLLKNTPAEYNGKPLLPLCENENILFVGPYCKSKALHSMWATLGRESDCISIYDAAEELAALRNFSFSYLDGVYMVTREDLAPDSEESSVELTRMGISSGSSSTVEEKDKKLISEAVQVADKYQKIVVCIGEDRLMSGEGASRTNITVPDKHVELLRRIHEKNKNIITVIFSGRPLDLKEICKYSKAILFAWFPGTEGGHGIMNILTGKACPSGVLSVSMPYSVGQCPIYYNQFSTGRQKPADTKVPYFLSAFIDAPNSPLYPFGYGLSYTDFSVSEIRMKNRVLHDRKDFPVIAEVTVTNTGSVDGSAVVQLYIRDNTASTVRPVKELKGFQKVFLHSGESTHVIFNITADLLSYLNANNEIAVDNGDFTVWIGLDSTTSNSTSFTLCKKD